MWSRRLRMNSLNHPASFEYRWTQRGLAWIAGAGPIPEEAEGYIRFLREHVESLDSVIEQYVLEAVTSFQQGTYFASAVMLGAASEKALYMLAISVAGALKSASERQKLQELLDRRKLFSLLELVRDLIDRASKAKSIPYSITEGAPTHLMAMYDAIRLQRNDAVHPMNAEVSVDSVRMLLLSFPYALARTENIRSWLEANPNSI